MTCSNDVQRSMRNRRPAITQQPRERSWWTGPDLYVPVGDCLDDYLVATQ